MLAKDELQALADDIKTNGQHHVIVMIKGSILDGRNRWKACALAKVKPRTEEYRGDSPTAFVISLNVKRRHLNSSQCALVGSEALPLFEAEAKERMRKGGGSGPSGRQKVATPSRAAAQAAAAVGTNRQYVTDMTKIKQSSPHLVARVRDGELTVPDAKLIAGRTKEEQGALLEKLDSGEARSAKEALRQLSRESRLEELSAASQPLSMGRRYPVILADPPWQYDDANSRGAAEDHYPTMSNDDIYSLPVAEHATKDAVLFLWATSALLPEALRAMESWGFTYKASAIWVKSRIGLGHWFRIRHEFILVGVRGAMVPPSTKDRPDSVITADITEHSRKPDEIHKLIERMWPTLSRLELFARRPRKGWDVWGNQSKEAA